MPLHRLTPPGYFGGLPGTHDYINDPGANGDPGAAAPADGKKGPAAAPGDQNEGTYFVAFKEPAQAINVNRPARALAENTDFLDDVIHRDFAIPTFIDIPSGHGGLTSTVLPGDVYVGDPGIDPFVGTLQLVSVIDTGTAYVPLIPAFGGFFPILISLIHDGSSNDQLGNGFFTNPTINFAITVPDTMGIRIYYYIRGRLKDLPTGILALRDQHNVTTALSASRIRNIEDDAAFKNLANTFIGSVTQTFNGPITFANTMSLTKGATIPSFTNDDATLKRVLLGEFRVSEPPGNSVYARLYKVRDSGGFNRGFELTYNAKWMQDTVPEWASDNTTANHHPTRLRFMGAGFSFSGEGLFYEVLDNALLGAGTWNESTWGSASVRALSLSGGGFQSSDRRASVPAFRVPFGVNTATDDSPENPYKFIFEASTLGAQKFRIYVGNDDDAAGTGGLGQVVFVHNAVWDPVALRWSHDDNTHAALAMFMRTSTNPNPGISGLSGSTISGPDSAGGTALVLLTRPPGGGVWTGQQWDKNSTGGHLRISGEYAYNSTIGGKEMRYNINPLLYRPIAGSDWAFSESFPATGILWVGTTASSYVYAPVEVSADAKIIGIFAEIDPIAQAVVGNRMKIEFFKTEKSTGVATLLGSDTADSTGNKQVIGINSSFYLEDDYFYTIRVRHGTGAGFEAIYRMQVNYVARYNAPGPGDRVGTSYIP